MSDAHCIFCATRELASVVWPVSLLVAVFFGAGYLQRRQDERIRRNRRRSDRGG